MRAPGEARLLSRDIPGGRKSTIEGTDNDLPTELQSLVLSWTRTGGPAECPSPMRSGAAMNLKNSISKRLYTWGLTNERCARVWKEQYWESRDGDRVVSCRSCPKLDAGKGECSIPFGSPVRKCSTAAQEAHLHSLFGKSVLEIGFGKHSIPRRLVTGAGGTWTGIEPMRPATEKPEIGKGGYGHAASMPFPDETFDLVAGVQSIEHFAETLPDPSLEVGHEPALREIYRVLKPSGSVYFCAPIHLHGHEMFITGDIPRIRALFDPLPWKNVTIERWREDYYPLERYRTPEADRVTWAGCVTNYSDEVLEGILANESVSLVVITAEKAEDASQ